MDDFEPLGLKGGVWHGVLRRSDAPRRVALTLLGEIVSIARISPDGEQQWRISVTLPVERIGEGLQTFILIADNGDGNEPLQVGARRLAALPVVAGQALDRDVAADISFLKAEIDLLKRELRRLAVRADQPQ